MWNHSTMIVWFFLNIFKKIIIIIIFLNQPFLILNNIRCIFTYFFTNIYLFKKYYTYFFIIFFSYTFSKNINIIQNLLLSACWEIILKAIAKLQSEDIHCKVLSVSRDTRLRTTTTSYPSTSNLYRQSQHFELFKWRL